MAQRAKTKVWEVMSRDIVLVHVDHTLGEAAGRMKEADVGWLLVVDSDEAVGVITDRDIVTQCLTGERDMREDAIDEAMSAPIVSCHADDSLEHAAEIMRDNRVRRLVVIDRTARCQGVVSIGDLTVGGLEKRETAKLVRTLCKAMEGGRKVGRERVGHGRATGEKTDGAPQSYSSAPVLKSERSADKSRRGKAD